MATGFYAGAACGTRTHDLLITKLIFDVFYRVVKCWKVLILLALA